MELDEECEVSPNVLVHDDSVLRTPLKSTLMLKDPEPGMKFKTVKDVVDYYTEYGRQKGFDVRIRGSDRKQRGTNRVTSFLLCFQREGTHEKIVGECEPSMQRNTSTCKCDCKAGMRCCWKKDGFYEVSVFKMIHNHDFFSPSKGMMMKANKNFPEAARNLTKRFSEEGLPIAKVAAVFGGNTIGFSGKDCQNHFGKTKKNPKKGDATAVLEFFKQKNIEDPLFFYAVQLDDEARATNFFWVDGRCRMQYDLFGDVVVFDTTYKTNAYSMPFAPFTGVNHHLQSIQFGCSLLLDETEETFVWLFKTWLAAMGGRPPTSILTDQDRAMTAAVGRVFPDTVHRFCLWHITNKFPSKFAQVIHKNETFSDELKLIISCCYRIHDFEEKWSAHMLKYGLEKDSWVIELYDMRTRWIPAFHLDIFYAGMNTTGRSESINSLYDGFVTHNTNLIDFVHGNDRLLAGIAFEENEFDFRSEHKTPIVKDRGAHLLKHAGKVYTKKVYLKFQKQWKFASNDYKIEKEEVQVDGYTIYTLRSRNRHNLDYWIVNFNVTTKEGDCECKYFQFMGILCGHLLKVLLRHDIDEIPSHFILRRWRQRANTYRSIFDNGGRPSDHDDFQTLRCTNLLRYTTELSSHCSSHGDDYEYAMDMIKSIFIEVDRRKEARKSLDVNTTSAETINEPPLLDPTQILLLNPNISQTKGRKKHADRIKRGIETAQDKNSPGASQGVQKRGCTRCKNGGMEYIGHDWRTCVNNPNSKQNRN